MKTVHLIGEPQESGSQHYKGLSIQFRIIRPTAVGSQKVRNNVAKCLIAFLALSSMVHAQDNTSDLVHHAHQQMLQGKVTAAKIILHQVSQSDRKEPSVIFEQALLDDAQGLHVQAREGYDHLLTGTLAKAAAVPSAVNLVALGRFTQARIAFAQLNNCHDAYTAGYSQLWQLWLLARTQKGKSAALRGKIARAATEVKPATPQQRALAELYAGNGSVDAVFAAIDGMDFLNPLQRRDARTEAAFFAGGYLQYVRLDAPSALRLYRQELSQPSVSIERPLIEKALAKLSVAHR